MARDDWRTLIEHGITLLQQNQPQKALTQLQRAERQAPKERDVTACHALVLHCWNICLTGIRKLSAGGEMNFLAHFAQQRVVRTASVWQARQPIHTRSVDRWRHYYDQAPEFFTRLAAIDSDYDVDIPASSR